MNGEDGQVYSVCILQFSCFTKYNRMQSKHKQTKCEHSRLNSYRLQLSQYFLYKSDLRISSAENIRNYKKSKLKTRLYTILTDKCFKDYRSHLCIDGHLTLRLKSLKLRKYSYPNHCLR